MTRAAAIRPGGGGEMQYPAGYRVIVMEGYRVANMVALRHPDGRETYHPTMAAAWAAANAEVA